MFFSYIVKNFCFSINFHILLLPSLCLNRESVIYSCWGGGEACIHAVPLVDNVIAHYAYANSYVRDLFHFKSIP